MRRGYIFTDKKESKRGLLSAALGLMSLVSLFLAVWLTFRSGGQALVRYGVVGLLCLIFSVSGLVCGILGKTEEDKFHLSAWIGIVLNALTILGVGFILYAGVNG
ncbi:MAG: DUF6142 family protein [Eubacteriales bacterium]|nr:DUF6142 family protein [Eubacteriales bacterium]